MINVSDAFKEKVRSGIAEGYLAQVKIQLQDGTELTVDSSQIQENGIEIEGEVSDSSAFSIGAAAAGKLTLVLDNRNDVFGAYDFFGATVTPKVGVTTGTETVEYVQRGIYTVDDPIYGDGIITLECLDNMIKFDRPYSESSLAYPATLGRIVRDACDVCDVALLTSSFDHDDYVVNERPEDSAVTFRKVLSWAAQIACKWARCNSQGQLVLGWYDWEAIRGDVDESRYHTISGLSSLSVATDDVVITGIKVTASTEGTEEPDSYLEGEEGYILSVEDNPLINSTDIATVAGWLGVQLIGLRFRPFSARHLSDPTIEAGDIVRILGRNTIYYSVITSTTFSVSEYQSTACNAKTPSRNSSTRYSESTKTYVALRKLVRQEQTARETAVANLASALANSSGLYMTTEEMEDGSLIYYAHNKPTMEESEIIWLMTAEAIGVSTDGGETYPYGFTVTGEMVTRLLAAEGVSADWITVGILQGIKIIATESSIGNWNIYDGVLGSAYDKSGTWYGVALDARQECFESNYNIFAVGQFDITNGGSTAKDAILGSWANAAFKIRADGHMASTAGTIGGWTIGADTLSGANGYLGMRMFANGYTPEGSTDVFFVVFYKDGNRPVGGLTVEGWKSISV